MIVLGHELISVSYFKIFSDAGIGKMSRQDGHDYGETHPSTHPIHAKPTGVNFVLLDRSLLLGAAEPRRSESNRDSSGLLNPVRQLHAQT